MPDIRINPNLPLQQNLPRNPYVRTSSQLTGFFNTARRTCKRPIEYLRYWISPCESPTDTLRKIDAAADRGLQRAKTRDIPLEPLVSRLHGDIDLRLGIEARANRTAALNAAQVGEVADLRPLLPDEEVTRAPFLQDRVDATDWPEKREAYQKQLAEKLSVFATLLQMRDRCGLQKKEKNNLALIALVKRATAEENPPSVWTLFVEHYNPTFFQKIRAAWFYCIYYLTSLISNTVQAYLEKFIENIIEDLVKKNSETRAAVFRTFIQNINQFLIADIQASKDFAYEKGHGNREDYQTRAIERHYGFSLSELCKKFSEKKVDEYSPQVRFFKDFQDIPILGWGFQAFEWVVNRLIIQRSMKYWILPNALESAVNTGIEATQPHNLPFSLSMTRFFTQRLEALRRKLEDKSKPPLKAGNFPGTEALPETIKYLKLALALEGPKTPLELRRQFEEIEANKGWGLEPKIAKGIEDSIVKSGDLLFRHLNENAEELCTLALERCLDPFNAEASNQALLEAEYNEEKLKLLRTAKSVFKELVDQGVSEAIKGADVADSWQIANDSFDDQREIARISIEELSAICTRMAQKVERSREAPTPENNVQTDIASILQIMQVIAGRKELQEELTNVKGVDKNAIWRIFTPLLERVEKLQRRVLTLQELQDHYPSHAAVVSHLHEMKDLLISIRDQFHAQPRHLQNPLIQSLGKTADEITRSLGAKAPLRLNLQGYIDEVSQLANNIVQEQQVIDAIQTRLYPPRNNNDDDVPEGLLDQMLGYQRGAPPQGFKPRACLAEIGKCLAHFPKEERIELERIIGDGSKLKLKWVELGEALQRIYTRHLHNKNRDKALLDQTLDKATTWIQEKIVKYKLVKKKDHDEMQVEMTAISTEVEALKRDIGGMQLNLSSYLSRPSIEVLSRALPFASAAIGWRSAQLIVEPIVKLVKSSIPSMVDWRVVQFVVKPIVGSAGPIAGVIASVAGGVGGKLLEEKWGTNDSSWRSIAAKTAIAVAGATASCLGWVPAASLAYLGAADSIVQWGTTAATLATAGYTGWSATKIVKSSIESRTNNQVWDLFNKAYDFSLKPRVAKAAMTRAMEAMSK